jgi:hypothetical protein
MEHKIPKIAKIILSKKNKSRNITISDLCSIQSYSNQNSILLAQKQKMKTNGRE